MKTTTNGSKKQTQMPKTAAKAAPKPKPVPKAKAEPRVPVALAVLKKLAADHGKVKVVGARDESLNGKTFEVVSVAEVDKKTYAFGFFPRIKAGDKIKNVSPANVEVVEP